MQSASCSKVLMKASKLAMDAIGNKEGSVIMNEFAKDPNGSIEFKSSRPGCRCI